MTTKQVRTSSQAWRVIWVPATVILLSLAGSFGEGFRNPPAGAFDLGRAGGRVAQVDDASAVQHNPANLVDLTNADFEYTPSVVSIAFHFQSTSVAESANTKEPWKVLPNLFVSKPIADGKGAIGFGMTVPYGLAVKWDTKSSAFDPATGIWTYAGASPPGAPFYTRLTTVNLNPTVSWKLTENLHAGLGLDATWSDLEFKQFIAPGWWAKAYGMGYGVGANAGITWLVTDRQRFAVTIRAPMDVDYHGHFRQYNSPSGDISSSFNSRIKYPTIMAFGYGVQINDAFRVETDLELIQFSRFENLPANVGANPYIPSQTIPENWRDTYTIGIAGDWRFDEHWTFRAGFQHYESPVPDSTFSPTIPDADQNVITIGVRYQKGRHGFEAAYGLDFYDTRRITTDQNPNFNGNYYFDTHLFSLAYHYAF